MTQHIAKQSPVKLQDTKRLDHKFALHNSNTASILGMFLCTYTLLELGHMEYLMQFGSN